MSVNQKRAVHGKVVEKNEGNLVIYFKSMLLGRNHSSLKDTEGDEIQRRSLKFLIIIKLVVISSIYFFLADEPTESAWTMPQLSGKAGYTLVSSPCGLLYKIIIRWKISKINLCQEKSI